MSDNDEHDASLLEPVNDQYEIVPRALLRNHDISADARSILFDWLSHTSKWKLNLKRQATIEHMTQPRAYKAVKELRNAGYLHFIKRQGAGGKWGEQKYVVANKPVMQCGLDGCQDCRNRVQETASQKTATRSTATRSTTSRSDGVLIEVPTTEVPTTEVLEDQSPSCATSADAESHHTGTCRIPDDFRPDHPHVLQAQKRRPDVDLGKETKRFVAYWKAVPGKGGEKRDWQRAWVNWVSRARGSSASQPELFDQAPPPAANDPTRFEEFWDAYPNRMARTYAEQAWAKVTRTVSPDVIVCGARAFAELCDRERTEKRFIPAPGKWLEAGRWDDEDIKEETGSPAAELAAFTSYDL